MSIEQLEQEGQPFQDVIKEFIHWCGNEYLFCTWGSMDLTELQRNMDFYQIPIPFQKPLMYYDVQKLYALQRGDIKSKPSLDHAVEELGVLEERPFHRALDDAYYTGKVLSFLNFSKWKPYLSVCFMEDLENTLYRTLILKRMIFTNQVCKLIIYFWAVLYGTGALSDLNVHVSAQCLLRQSGVVTEHTALGHLREI